LACDSGVSFRSAQVASLNFSGGLGHVESFGNVSTKLLTDSVSTAQAFVDESHLKSVSPAQMFLQKSIHSFYRWVEPLALLPLLGVHIERYAGLNTRAKGVTVLGHHYFFRVCFS
jgi:hypothetical protein